MKIDKLNYIVDVNATLGSALIDVKYKINELIDAFNKIDKNEEKQPEILTWKNFELCSQCIMIGADYACEECQERFKIQKEQEKQPELLPCPFCGSNASLDFSDHTEGWGIVCEDIMCIAADIKPSYAKKKLAISSWNKRSGVKK